MKLSDHVDIIRALIETTYDNYLARLGLAKNKISDIIKISHENKQNRLKFEDMITTYIEEMGDYSSARNKLIDEMAFTLFNRLAAIKVMESASLFPPVLSKNLEHGDRSFGHKAWLEINPHMKDEELEGIQDYIEHAFNTLGKTLPLYHNLYPYAAIPEPTSLNEIIDTINAVEKDSQVGIDIWESDDILGWLYESYNNKKKKKHKESKEKTEYDKVSLQSQVYTPRWVVKFLVENSLGKLYLEMYPNSTIKNRYKIANAPIIQERNPKPLHEIKIIDPACGSGNFLLYAFDFLYDLYKDQINNYGADYDEIDIPKTIIENNLHGIDLDNRGVQLAQLGLFIKAKKKQRKITNISFNIVSSDFYLPEYNTVEHIFSEGALVTPDQQHLIEEIWGDLQYAYKFGSLIRIEEKLKNRLKNLEATQASSLTDLFYAVEIEEHKDFAEKFFLNLKAAVDKYAQRQGTSFLTDKTEDAITFLELITTEYDVATANPPYTDSTNYGTELKNFIETNYQKPFKFHTNLYAAFIKRCFEMTNSNGKIALVHPLTFMYIKTFEDVREYILTKTHINILAEIGIGGVFDSEKVNIDITFYVLEKNKNDLLSLFIDLQAYKGLKNKKAIFNNAFEEHLLGNINKHNYLIDQNKLAEVKGSPFIYWISDDFRKTFNNKSLDDILDVRQGIATGNNNRTLRYFWELLPNDLSKTINDTKTWKSYAKGGAFTKWWGNLWLTIDYSFSGYDYLSSHGNHLPSKQHYFKRGITYSASGRGGYAFRLLPENCLFDVGGSSIFTTNDYGNIDYVLSLLNSKLTFYIADCLNPTANIQVGDLKRVPFVSPTKEMEDSISYLGRRCREIIEHLCQFSIVEPNYVSSPFQKYLHNSISSFLSDERHLQTQILINEAIINEKIFKVYKLTKYDEALVLIKEGKSIGSLPVENQARDAYLKEKISSDNFPLDFIRNFIEALPTMAFSLEEQEKVEREFTSLYQSNNDLEEFCIRHQINPINVWYWFKQSDIIPKQRMNTIAMEFLIDMVREILMQDEDGIIPLVPNAGEKILIEQIREKFHKKGFTSAQYSSFHIFLGHSIEEYLNSYFFVELSKRLNLFRHLPMTPFIWHLSSGPEQGFDCYIIIYKWSRDKLMKLRSVYIEHRERSLINRQSDLMHDETAQAQTEKDLIFRQLHEIESFKTKIDDLLSENYNPILDDGVGKNIAPLQKKKMITYDVLNSNELKKYLNADW